MNLIEWQYECDVIQEDEFPGLVPFAPEVVYWNGKFYMYTSPHGRGHYVLESVSPTGPFHKITENLGHNIDMSIFIDDDGKWYAYWADDRGIAGCQMKSPTEFGEEVLTGAYMDGWTEGPFVVKKGGKYHLSYTGNHYLSKGYRINTAISDNPLGKFRDNSCNPVVVCTEGEVTGLGHSSTVMGPDLHTYYLIYHNMKSDLTRGLNIDAITFDENRSYVLGPTTTERPVPAPPDWMDSAETEINDKWDVLRGKWCVKDGKKVSRGIACIVSKQALASQGIVEFHVAAIGDTRRYGIIFSEEKEIRIEIDSRDNTIYVLERKKIISKAVIPYDFVHEALHEVRIEYGDKMIIYVDGLKRLEVLNNVKNPKIGYYGDGEIVIGSTVFADTQKVVLTYPVQSIVPGGKDVVVDVRRAGYYVVCASGCLKKGGKYIVVDGKKEYLSDEKGGVLLLRMYLESGTHKLEQKAINAEYVYV